jgi:hypothetical protein
LEKWDVKMYLDFLLCKVGKMVDGALAPSEYVFPKLARTEKSPSELNTSINLIDLLQMVAEATSVRAPSQYGFKNRSTINWKLAIEVKATINLNAWRVVGANCASSKIDLPINLRNNLGVILCVLFDLRGLARTAIREAQLDSFELRHLARATNREAQLDSCELRHLARATLEAQLDLHELRLLAGATLEAQLDLCELSPKYEMAFDDQTSTKTCFSIL